MSAIHRLIVNIIIFLASTISPTAAFFPSSLRVAHGHTIVPKKIKTKTRNMFLRSRPTYLEEKNSFTSSTTGHSKAVDIALSYKPTPFRPAPFARNPHIQTIGGAVLRGLRFIPLGPQLDFSYWPPRPTSTNLDVADPLPSWWDRRVRVETPDGDFFDVDYKYCKNTRNETQGVEKTTSVRKKSRDRSIAVMVHGLESSSCSPQIIDAAMAFLAIDMDVVCVNFRSCSGEPNKTPGAYHLGFTDDLKFFLAHALPQEAGRTQDVYLVGFSLGANVVLKLLGELQESALSSYNVRGAAVSAAPFDLIKSSPKFSGTIFNRVIYDSNFLRSLKRKAEVQYELLGEHGVPYRINQVKSAQSIAEFENAFIAPTYGFADNYDYYQKTSCASFIDNIHVPTLVINSLDDPFFDPSCYPKECTSRPLKLHYTRYGGHLGFMFHIPKHDEMDVVSSWMPTELARFLSHVHLSQ